MNVGVLEAILRLDNTMSGQLQNAAKDLKRTGQTMARTGMRMSAMVTAPIVGIGAAAVKMAVDAEESANKFEVVMGDAASGLREEFQQLAEFMPLTLSEMEALTAGIQDMLVPMGVARDTGAEMSLEILKLTGDISSFQNVTQEQVLDAYTSALAGMSRPMRQFGVDASQARLEQIALAEGLMRTGDEMSNTVRAQALLIATTLDSTDALGDQERTADSTANQLRQLWKEIRQVGEDIGQILIPAIRPLIAHARDAVQWFGNLDEGTQKWILTIGAVAAAVGPVLVVLGTLLSALGSIAGAVAAGGVLATGLSGLVALLSGPVGVAAAVGIAAAAIGNFIGKTAGPALEEWIAGTKESLAELQEGITNLNDTVGDLGLAIADKFRDSMPQITQAISDGVAAGKDMNTILGELTTKFEAGTEEGDALRAAMVEIGGEMNAASRESAALEQAQDAAAQGIRNLGEAATGTEPKVKELSDTLSSDLIASMDAVVAHGRAVEEALARLGIPVQSLFNDAQNLSGAVGGTTMDLKLLGNVVSGMPPPIQEMGLETRGMLDELGKVPPLVSETDTAMGGWFDTIRTGKDWLDSLIGSVLNLVGSLIGGSGLGAALKQTMGGIAGMFSGQGGGGLGGLWEGIKGMFGGGGGGMPGAFDASGMLGGGGGGGFMDSLKGMLGLGGGGAGGLISGIGGSIMSIFAGPLGGLAMKGITELGKKLWDGLKSAFGGPGEEELLGRDIVHQFESDIAGLLDQTQMAEAGNESWKKTVIGLRDAFLILGKSEQEAMAAAEELWASSKEGSEASQQVVSELGPVFEEVMRMMDDTGMTFTELKDSVVGGARDQAAAVAESYQDQAAAAKQAGESIQASVLARIDFLEGKLSEATGKQADEIRLQLDALRKQAEANVQAAADAATATTGIVSEEFRRIRDEAGLAVSGIEDHFRRIDIRVPVNFDVDDIPTLESSDAGLHGPGFQTRPGEFKTVPGPPNQSVIVKAHGGEQIGRRDDRGLIRELRGLREDNRLLRQALKRQQEVQATGNRDRSLMGK